MNDFVYPLKVEKDLIEMDRARRDDTENKRRTGKVLRLLSTGNIRDITAGKQKEETT